MNSDKAAPLVSIGMPLYNEEKFLRQSLESLTSQDYANIEIIISDNHSTDGTQLICDEFTSRFKFISYNRFSVNKGIIKNFNYVLQHAKGKYFYVGFRT